MTNAYKMAVIGTALLALGNLAHAADGTIRFRGAVVEDTCKTNTNDRLQPQLSGCDAKVAQAARVHVEQRVVPANATTSTKGAQKLAVVVTEYL